TGKGFGDTVHTNRHRRKNPRPGQRVFSPRSAASLLNPAQTPPTPAGDPTTSTATPRRAPPGTAPAPARNPATATATATETCAPPDAARSRQSAPSPPANAPARHADRPTR